MYYIKLLRSYSHIQAMRSNIARTYIRLFKNIRTCNIYIMDHEIISPDIDGSYDVYSSRKPDPLPDRYARKGSGDTAAPHQFLPSKSGG